MKRLSAAVIVALSVVLVACGGSQEQTATPKVDSAGAVSSPLALHDLMQGQAEGLGSSAYGTPVAEVNRAQRLQKLSRYFNGRFAKQPEALMGQRQAYSGAKSLDDVAKGGNTTPSVVHRFFNTLTGVHFYTISDSEKVRVTQTLPHFNYEGPAFYSLTAAGGPLSPVYRFYSTYTGTHFYTIYPEERDYVIQNFGGYFSYEGIAWYATMYGGPGWVPMHRFYNIETGTHFYTTSEEERLRVIATIPVMEYEGIGYFVRAADVPLTASRISSSNAGGGCISPTSTYQNLSCEGAGELPLAHQVEGNREIGNTERFAALPGRASTDCTVDNVTGLVWETKDAGAGPRGNNRRFTHLDRTDRLQVVDTSMVWVPASSAFEAISIPRAPTQAEVDASDNSKAYVDYVNGISLCGFSDWRIPTASELINIVNFGFEVFSVPNSGSGPYLSSDATTFQFDGKNASGEAQRYILDAMVTVARRNGLSSADSDGDFATVEPRSGSFQIGFAGTRNLVLVRGLGSPGQSRYSTSTLPYGKDAANNVVIDNWSKLMWRRCLEGEVWTGSVCGGQPLAMTLYGALERAALSPGWRLPGIKELDSIFLRQADSSVTQWDTDAFPSTALNANPKGLWSMSRHWRPLYGDGPATTGLPGYQAKFQGTTLGVPAASISLMSRYKTGYARLLWVHP